jgi:Flp pilus assembly protein TadD
MMNRLGITILLTLALWVIGSLLPEFRMWGVGFLFPAPTWIWVFSLGLPVLSFAALEFWPGKTRDSVVRLDYRAAAIATGMVALILFVFVKQSTHFLGDGVLKLAALGMEQPVVSGGDAGTVYTLLFVKNLLGSGEAAALTAYRVTSIVSGLFLIVISFFLAQRVLDDRARAAMFALGQLSGGFMLMYFGYVGNYALLILSVSAFALLGIGTCRRKVSRWWTLLPFTAAVWFHALGWTLLPVLIYVLVVNTPFSYRLRNTGVILKAGLVLLVVVGVCALFYWKYTNDFSFRFAFLSPVADRFTVDGYTLFSPKHFLDLANLYLLLIPGLLVAMVFVWRNPGTPTKRDPARTFLWLLFWCAFLVAFLVNPRLGMPRSWDLLALAGVPATMLLFYLILTTDSPQAGKVAMLCVTLGVAGLLPRAYVQASPIPSARLAQAYFSMDPQRSRTAVHEVGEYLLDNDYTAEYGRLSDFRTRSYPEEKLRDRLDFLFRDGKMSEAEQVCRSITRMNPRMYSAWMFLGFIYNNASRYDSAAFFLEVADGLKPYTTGVLNELGRAYFYSNRHEAALELWQRSLTLDSLQYVPLLAIGSWHKMQGDKQKTTEFLSLAASRPGAPGNVRLELARDHAENNRMTEAQAALVLAIANQADTLKVQALMSDYPTLALPPAGTEPAGEPSSDGTSDGA